MVIALEPLFDPAIMNEQDWLEKLGPEAYRVMRQQGTERPFTSPFVQWTEGGVYRCKGCDEPLFQTANQFDAGCGWPSFDQPVEGAPIVTRLDRSHGMVRTEVRCGRCDSHLGHVFPDGPPTTGERFCINGICLTRETGQ